MLLHIFLLIIVFAFIFMLLGFAWDSFPMFVLSSLMCIMLAGLSVMIQIPFTSGNIDVFSDDGTRVFFILMCILNGALAALYKIRGVSGEAGSQGHD